MTIQSAELTMWLRERGHPDISLPRWQQQVDLLNEFYQADACMVLQYAGDEFQVVCSHQAISIGLSMGAQFQDQQFAKKLTTDIELIEFTPFFDSKSKLKQFPLLYALPLHWADGRLFGAIVICNAKLKAFGRLLRLLKNSRNLIQGELKRLFFMQQVKMMAIHDELTSMLNLYGFNLVSQRQLSLSRHLGIKTAIILVKDTTQYHDKNRHSQQQRQIARTIHHHIRDVDVSARIAANLFVIMIFIDKQTNIESIANRLKNQLIKKDNSEIIFGYQLFEHDVHLTTERMIEDAQQHLK